MSIRSAYKNLISKRHFNYTIVRACDQEIFVAQLTSWRRLKNLRNNANQ